jgi:hypothetical protein
MLCAATAGVLVTLGMSGAARADTGPPAACAASQLTGSLIFDDAAAGNRYARLVVINHAEADCTMQGYPALQLIAVDGRLLGTEVDPDDSTPAAVTVPNLGTATSRLHWHVGPCFTQGDDGTPESRPALVTVTPPGDAAGVDVPWEFGPVCGEPDGPSLIHATAFARS